MWKDSEDFFSEVLAVCDDVDCALADSSSFFSDAVADADSEDLLSTLALPVEVALSCPDEVEAALDDVASTFAFSEDEDEDADLVLEKASC